MRYLAFLSLILCSCADGPKVDICVYHLETRTFVCTSSEDKPYVCKYDEACADKMVSTTQEGMRNLTDWVKRSCNQ